MRAVEHQAHKNTQQPMLLGKATELANYIQSLTPEQIEKSMKVSPGLALKTHQLWQDWTSQPQLGRPAIDIFSGDIYSGLQTSAMVAADRQYANQHLLILSGLYGGLRALDNIHPYRLEMGYRLPDKPYSNLYKFWGEDIAKLIPEGNTVVNLSAIEYTKVILPYLSKDNIYTPQFLTRNHRTKQPTFVAVHAKIARGAFASWLIRQRVSSSEALYQFTSLGYQYDTSLSRPNSPAFVCEEFGGLGLSVRSSS